MSIQKIAWNFILNNDISEFKISLDTITDIVKKNGWYINTYNDSSDIMKDLKISNEHKNKKGFTYANLKANNEIEYFIFFQNNLSYGDKIFVILHEIGHIMINHTYCRNCGNILGRNSDDGVNVKQELEADMFAFEVLAPSHILEQLDNNTAEEIKNISLLSYDDALKYITELHKYKHEGEDLSELKNKLSKQYKKYMYNIKKNEFKKVISKNMFVKSMFLGLITLSIISVFSTLHLINTNSKLKKHIGITDLSNTEIESQLYPSIFPTMPLTELQLENTTESPDANISEKNYVNEKTVYVTSSGKKYHLQDCRYVKNKTNIQKFGINDALKSGYKPCSVCIR